MIKRFIKNTSVKNATWLIMGRVVQMVISLIVGMFTARYLGPGNYGLINYANAYISFFMAFCTLGINSILVKELIDYPDDEGEIIGTSLFMRAISSLLSAGMIIALVSILDEDEPTTIVVTALSSVGLVFNIFETFNYWFQSKLQSKVTAVTTLIAYGITSVYKVVLLILGKSVEWFAFASTLDYICIAILQYISYKRYGGQKLCFSKQTGERILNQSIHFILPSLMVAIYGYTDKFMIKQMLSDVDVGYYATATHLCGMWCFVLVAIIDSMTPAIMDCHKKDKKLFDKRNRRLYALVFYISVIVSCLFCLFGEFLLVILYGKQYIPAGESLKVITWYTAFSYLGTARNAWIVCENKQRYLKYLYMSAAICNVLFNLLFIPLWGATGAAVASLLTQILTTIVIPFFIKDLRYNSILMLEGIYFKKVN